MITKYDVAVPLLRHRLLHPAALSTRWLRPGVPRAEPGRLINFKGPSHRGARKGGCRYASGQSRRGAWCAAVPAERLPLPGGASMLLRRSPWVTWRQRRVASSLGNDARRAVPPRVAGGASVGAGAARPPVCARLVSRAAVFVIGSSTTARPRLVGNAPRHRKGVYCTPALATAYGLGDPLCV